MKTIKSSKLSFFAILTFSLILVLGSCSAGKSGVNAGKKLFTDFFVGDAGTQYFIKPLTFENPAISNEDLLADITFRYKEKIRDSATVNFSIVSRAPIKNINSVTIMSDELHVHSEGITFLFNERSKSGFISRFSFKIPVASLKGLVDSGYEWKFEVMETDSKTRQYVSKRSTTKSLEKLDQSLFILLD